MAEERTDALIEFGADDVLEAAGLIVRFGVVDRERVFEQALREAMTANDAACALAAYRRELRLAVLQFDEMTFAHASQNLGHRLAL